MMFSKFFKSKKVIENGKRVYTKSKIDLRLLPNQVIYVEGVYNKAANKVISKTYDTISSTLRQSNLSADFLYLPVITKYMQKQEASLDEVLSYYFPNIRKGENYAPLLTIPQTDSISRLLFSFLPYNEKVSPGFFRYMGQDSEGFFVYEYYLFTSNRASEITNQINNYINTISPPPHYTHHTPLKEEKSVFYHKSYKIESFGQSLFDDIDGVCEKKQPSKEYELISQIKSDIQNLKELGFYEILLKEIGSILFENEKDKIFQPSQLVIDDDFRIFLPDFDGMEIEMTPLPKSLFVLFLRHPEGINLKSLIDYKIELLEIYKLLSYRETYFDMVESVNRICNPIEGSINEKLSRIKEAFLKKMSIDTAKHYIVKGERGMKKKIEIDRSLIVFSNALVEIGLTKTSE